MIANIIVGLLASIALALGGIETVLLIQAHARDCPQEEKVLILQPAGKGVLIPIWVCPR